MSHLAPGILRDVWGGEVVSGTGSHSTLKFVIYQLYQVSRVESPNDVSKKKTSNLVGKCFTFYFYLSFRLVAKRLLACVWSIVALRTHSSPFFQGPSEPIVEYKSPALIFYPQSL